mgnify:CR=1 FL=1
MANATQVTTGKVRFSYVNIFEPKAQDNGVEKYSVTLLIPKADTVTMKKIKSAIDAAKKVYSEKHNGKSAPGKTTIHDGDGVRPSDGEEFGAECKGHYVMTVSSKNKPLIVYPDKSLITEPTEVYSGCYGKAIINFFAYETAGNRGISAGLNGIMKLEDGEPLGGAVITDSDWEQDESFEMDDLLD